MPTQESTLYKFEPEVVTKINAFVQKTLMYTSLAMMNLPVEESLEVSDQKYEWDKINHKGGVGYELDIVSPPGFAGVVERKSAKVPAVYTSINFSYDEYLRINKSNIYGFQDRIRDAVAEMALRMDLIAYAGDTKYSVNDLGGTTPGTEFTTILSVASPTAAMLTLQTALGQLRAAVKFDSRLYNPNSTIILELSPDVYDVAAGTKTATETASALDQLEAVLKRNFPGGSSRVVMNPYLSATYTVDSAGVATISAVSTDLAVLYIQDPSVMKIVKSPLDIRMGPLDPTKGIVIQPVQRFTRIDVEPLGVLVETNVTTA